MATLLRTHPSTRLVSIDAFHRLQSHHTKPFIISIRNLIQLRFITQTRPALLKINLTSSASSSISNNDSSSPTKTAHNHQNNVIKISQPQKASLTGKRTFRTNRKERKTVHWSAEEDENILRLAKTDKSPEEIYVDHFQHRDYRSLVIRVNQARAMGRIQKQLADGSISNAEIENDTLLEAIKLAGPHASLRALSTALTAVRKKRRNANMDDTAVLRSKKVTIPDNKQKDWTPEEDTLLEQLVQKHIALPDPTIWYKVAGGGIDGSHLLRSVAACQRRWKTLHPSPIFSTGRWTKKENHLLQQSISEQFDGKYQVAVDVLDDSLPEQTRKELQQKFERRYLNMSLVAPQFSLPMLKWGSQRLRKLDWIKISEHVKSRDQYTCRGHFYGVYDNGRRGVLTKDELERLEEGLRLFENDYWKISKHVGTRSTPQVTKFIALKGWLKTKQADSENSTPKDPEIKQ